MDYTLSTLLLVFVTFGILCEILWFMKIAWRFISWYIITEIEKALSAENEGERNNDLQQV